MLMEEGEQTVHGPGGVEIIISFLPNKEILLRIPPAFNVRTETFEVALTCPSVTASENLILALPSPSATPNGGATQEARKKTTRMEGRD